jgi:hypothetical protein
MLKPPPSVAHWGRVTLIGAAGDYSVSGAKMSARSGRHRGQRQAVLRGCCSRAGAASIQKGGRGWRPGCRVRIPAPPFPGEDRSGASIGRGRLPTAAHEPSGFGTGVLAALEDGGAGDQGRLVAFGSLYEALAAGGEVVDDLGRVQAQAVEID